MEERKLKQVEEIITDFFNGTAPDALTDYMECYEALGKIKDIILVEVK